MSYRAPQLLLLLLLTWLSSQPAQGALPQDPRPFSQIPLSPAATDRFYDEFGDALAWGEEADFAALLDTLHALERHGLNPSHYHLQQLEALTGDPAARDRLATDAWLSAAAHMLYGKLDPLSVEPKWTATGRQADLVAMLLRVLAFGDITNSLESLAPTYPVYERMLAEYESLSSLLDQPIVAIPAGSPALRAGMSNERVVALQERLIQLEFLEASHLTGTMDAVTEDAVRLFQRLSDLDDDGVVGAATLMALNRGPQNKLNQLRVNMERLRWLPDDLGRRHIRANIADFSVTAWSNGVKERSHLSIVGRHYRRTPVFSDEIEYLVFNPWWEVPPSIARIDKLPQFRLEPGLVQDLGFQIRDRSNAIVDPATVNWDDVPATPFPFRLRQAPGPENALGQVKIMFPNEHNVYIHDTPLQGLFANRQRAFSSGCLRTQYPLELAAWVLSETPGWSPERIEEVVTSGTETRVNISARIPVHVLYLTVVDDEGLGLRYLNDIYQRDAAVLDGLRATPH